MSYLSLSKLQMWPPEKLYALVNVKSVFTWHQRSPSWLEVEQTATVRHPRAVFYFTKFSGCWVSSVHCHYANTFMQRRPVKTSKFWLRAAKRYPRLRSVSVPYFDKVPVNPKKQDICNAAKLDRPATHRVAHLRHGDVGDECERVWRCAFQE